MTQAAEQTGTSAAAGAASTAPATAAGGAASTAPARAAADCCTVDPRIARHFDQRWRELAATGELPEMVKVSRTLVGLLDDVVELRPTLLELGCGSGALTVELLGRGAASADGVDLSAESLAAARRRAGLADVAERAHFENGDGAQVGLTAHDWVVLDRVLCCYPHIDRLLGNAISAARTRVAISVPHRHGWRGLLSRLVVSVDNATGRFRSQSCPGYVHDVDRIERLFADAGFARLRHTTVGLWYAAVWERPAGVSVT